MKIEIINVGTELLLGEIVNTNAVALQKMCKDLGFDVYHQSVVGDNCERLMECLQIAFQRGADCVITTGGLGPTNDDLTKELSAEYLNLKMVYWEDEAQKVEAKCRFVTGLDEIPMNNFKQAYFPEHCTILENEVGTANGCIMKNDHKMIINLPGPPKEMNYVVEHELIPYLKQFQKERLYTCDLITMGIGESTLAEKLKALIDAQQEVTIALYASEETVRIRLACKAKNQQMADEAMKPFKEKLMEMLKEYLILENNLTYALSKILPAYQLIYHSDFAFEPSFLLSSGSDQGDLIIQVDKKNHPLGEIIQICFDYHERHHEFEIGLLKKAEYSMAKLQSKVVIQLYRFLKQTL